MGTAEYPQCVRELLESEILGEAALLALYGVAKNPTEKYQFGTFLQLETETKACLRPLLYKYQISFQEEVNQEQVDGFVALYLENSWPDFLGALRNVVVQFLSRFEEIVTAGPQEDRALLQAMVVHESAFLHWIDKELSGDKESSLDAVLEQLNNPLPKLG